MTNPKVSLYYCCRAPEGWKRFPAAIGRNGKIRPRYAQIGKSQTHFDQGHYELRYMQDGKMIWRNVGEDATAAQAEQGLTTKRLAVRVAAKDAGVKIEETPGRPRFTDKAKEFRDRQEARGKSESIITFDNVIEEFRSAVNVTYLDELNEGLILRWYAALRKRGNSDRTINNKHTSLFGFLRWAGVDTKKLAERAPKFTEKSVEVYNKDELKKFFASLTHSYHRIVFETLLKTGMRMQEAVFLEWHDIDFARGTITVSEKNDLGFVIKDRAGRTLPIPSDLVDHLQTWKETRGGRLVLGTSNDTPNWKWLQLLKRLARIAGLNCGHCQKCRERNECERWYLHKFRSTYTTNLLRAGIDARTVMQYTGHEDMETVLRYLSPAEGSETQAKVNTIKWGTEH
jgi:integrase